MNRAVILTAVLSLTLFTAFADAASKGDDASKPANTGPVDYFNVPDSVTHGSVKVEGRSIDYKAIAGTIIVHPKDWDDAEKADQAASGDQSDKSKPAADAANNPTAKAVMFYVAYFKEGEKPGDRPITFLYNGGPGSSTVWLHMGAFGPKRVVTSDDTHTPAAPYDIVNNDYSLLDASDLVFIDAPGTGFSRITGKDKEKAFYGVDEDASAFTRFIEAFLTKYSRWNSPKYLFGESYGTPRSAVVVNDLETNDSVDFNGVILLSQILNFDLSVDGPDANPGVDLPYVIALPTYAATAWYHNKLPGKRPDQLEPFLQQVEAFGRTRYLLALQGGSNLPAKERAAVAEKLHEYTGLPVSYILKANLRIDGGEFEKNLQDSADMTTGRLDTRFSGPTMDPLSKEADYDPQSAAISSAYVSAFNNYVRTDLNYGQNEVYNPEINVFKFWDFKHVQPGQAFAFSQTTNVMPDLATAMKYNPDLKIMLNGGYFDLATPFYEGWYEMHHLPIPDKLQANISYAYYQSGHMVYAHTESLQQIHDNVANFIRKTDNLNDR